MTIAVCCVSPEGVVFGADSTASMMVPDGFHYLNHTQKIFEVGSTSTLGAVTWGLAALGPLSHRTQLALLADAMAFKKFRGPQKASELWIEQFWPNYEAYIAPALPDLKLLHAKAPHNPKLPPSPQMRDAAEQKTYNQQYLGLMVGFCIGGYDSKDRLPKAFEIKFDPLASRPTPTAIGMGDTRCWGAPRVFERIVKGLDPEIRQAILLSGKWNGTPADLDSVLATQQLYLPSLPIRDAVDFVHSCISSTIKTLKFSHLSQTCGGPIEFAVLTTDREFRWVRHKEWDVAIKEGHALWKI